jgi:soluble cytochrome b562
MEKEGPSKYWNYILITEVLYAPFFITYSYTIIGTDFSFNYPVAFGLVITGFSSGYFVSKDRAELSKHNLNVTNRSTILTAILSYMSITVYTLFYLYKRNNKISEWQDSRNSSKTDIEEAISEIKSAIGDAGDLIETEDIDAAEDQLESIDRKISEHTDTANNYNFDDLHDELLQLDEKREELRDEIDTIRHEQRRQRLQEDISTVTSELDEIERLVDKGSLDSAQAKVDELEADIEPIATELDQAHSGEFENLRSDLTQLRERREDLLDEINRKQQEQRRQRLRSEINAITSELDEIEPLIEEGTIDEARTRVEELESDIESVDVPDSQPESEIFDDVRSDITQMKNRTTKFLSRIDEKQREQDRRELEDEIATIDSELDDIESNIETGEIDNAESRLEEVASELESVEASLDDHESGVFEDIRTNLTQLTQRRENLLDELSAKQREKRHQNLEEEIDTLRSELDQIDDLTEDGSLDEAKTKLDELASTVDSVAEKSKQHGFDDLREKVETLDQTRETKLEEVTRLAESITVPTEIPQEPNVSVDYAALTDKEPIGGGGNADVTRATLPASDGDVTLAIKEPRMAGTLHTDTIESMLDEAETWDKLDDNDHIVGVVDYGSAPMPWIAMEYMDAGHLGDRSGELEVSQALWTAVAITKGVRHAHRRGVAHLDLKPENVLFRSVESGWDVPKVADWGLSKHLLDHSKSIEGLSPQYAAPEQFDDDYGSADDITDIYQLGTVLYELFTGQPPFDGKPAKAMHKVLHEEPTAPSDIADVPEKLDDILLTALAKEKHDRYDDIVYFRDDLQDLFDTW